MQETVIELVPPPTGLIEKIAATLGYPAVAVEFVLLAVLFFLLLIAALFVLAVFRIRKELISLNLRVFQIGRLIEVAVLKPKAPRQPEVAAVEERVARPPAEPPETSDPADKWKL